MIFSVLERSKTRSVLDEERDTQDYMKYLECLDCIPKIRYGDPVTDTDIEEFEAEIITFK